MITASQLVCRSNGTSLLKMNFGWRYLYSCLKGNSATRIKTDLWLCKVGLNKEEQT